MSGESKKVPKVVLFLATNEKAGRDKLQGILRYVRSHTPWHIHLIENRVGEQQLGDLRAWGATGLIVARMPELACQALSAHLPTVVMDSPALYEAQLPSASFVTCDSAAVGRAGADHLLRQRFRNLAYVADAEDWDWSVDRGLAFAAQIRLSGLDCAVYGGPTERARGDWALEQAHLRRWLEALPKPVGLFAPRDGRARQVLETCLLAGIDVPGEVAILGVDNEEILCENTSPTLSSVQPDFEAGGYEAAHLLERLMRRTLRKPQRLLYGVKRVVVRESSRFALAADCRYLRGLEYIRLNAAAAVGVPAVAKHMGVSRRMAELLFRRHGGNTILGEIQLVRVARLKAFLAESDLPIRACGALCGFGTDMHAKRVFKQVTGITMSRFRVLSRDGRT